MKKCLKYSMSLFFCVATLFSSLHIVHAQENEESSKIIDVIENDISKVVQAVKNIYQKPVISDMEATILSNEEIEVNAKISTNNGLSILQADVYENDKKIDAILPEYTPLEENVYSVHFSIKVENPGAQDRNLVIKLWAANLLSVLSKTEEAEVHLEKENRFVVCIDPGHQGVADYGQEPVGPGSSQQKTRVAAGTCGVTTGVPESQVNLEVCLKLEQELVNRGYEVVMCRTSQDVSISNVERAQIANECGADIFIRVHCNATAESVTSMQGTSTYAPSPGNPYNGNISGPCQELARYLLEYTCASANSVSQGLILRDDLSGTNWSKVPVALIELGFLTNPTEDALLNSDAYQQKLAEGMANGIDAYFEGK